MILRLLMLIAGLVSAAPAVADLRVVTHLEPLFSMARDLAEGSTITVERLTSAPLEPALASRRLGRLAPEELARLAEADAVISLGQLWREDRLYEIARQHNIRVVEIDASADLTGRTPGVSRISPSSQGVSWDDKGVGEGDGLRVWLSPGNAATMARIIASDLARLSPQDATTLAANRLRMEEELRALQLAQEARFLDLGDRTLFGLTDRFLYLTNDLGLFVDGYFLRQGPSWTDVDFAVFGDWLETRHITHVLHHWQPDPAVAEAITQAGAHLVVLNADLQDGEGFTTWLGRLMSSLHTQLSEEF